MKLQQLLKEKYFFSHRHEFFLILQDILNLPLEKIFSSNIEISNAQLKDIKEKYDRFHINKEPIEYILGYTEFWGLKFKVNKDVLIPRPETEYLVKYSINYASNTDIYFDIWTWSWIIWITLALKTNKKVVCSDISEKAIKVAKENAKNLCKNCNIEFIISNLWAHISNYKWNKFICANLPYVDENFKLDEYAKKEPNLALFAPENWLKLYKDLLNQLEKNTYFAFELTKKQAKYLLDNYSIKANILPTCHNNIKILLGKKI